jgi:prepilin-type processing-associated H-X9-DG protein
MYRHHPVGNQILDRATGFTIVELLVAGAVIALLLGIALPAVQQSRESARRAVCRNHLRQLSAASESFLGARQGYPDYRPPRASGLSGHAQLLPFLDQGALWQQLPAEIQGNAIGEPPACNGYEQVLRASVPTFVCPSDSVPEGGNSYRACFGTTPGVHATWAFGYPRPPEGTSMSLWGVFTGARTDADVRDGLSQTAFYSERVVGDGDTGEYVPSRDIAHTDERIQYPEDGILACAAVDGIAPHVSYAGWTWLLSDPSQTTYNHVLPPNSDIPDCANGWSASMLGQGAMTARSLHPGLVHVAFGDGSVRTVSSTIDLAVWRAIASIHGGEVTGVEL